MFDCLLFSQRCLMLPAGCSALRLHLLTVYHDGGSSFLLWKSDDFFLDVTSCKMMAMFTIKQDLIYSNVTEVISDGAKFLFLLRVDTLSFTVSMRCPGAFSLGNLPRLISAVCCSFFSSSIVIIMIINILLIGC